MTGLSLELSNQAYCLTKTSFVLSLIFAILAVFYASCLQRRFNRLLTGEDIRRWIRGSSRKPGAKRWVWSVDEEIKARCFIPSVSSVITASAPQLLLSISLTMLVIALGVYLGNFGTAEPNNTKFVFALYIIGLVFFGGAYSMAQYFDIEEICSEIDIINGYLTGWKANHTNQDGGDRHQPQAANNTTRTNVNSESNPLLKQAGTIGRNSLTTSRSERMRRDQAKNSQPPDPEGGNTEDSISKSGSEASSRSKSSIKGKERVGKND